MPPAWRHFFSDSRGITPKSMQIFFQKIFVTKIKVSLDPPPFFLFGSLMTMY